MNPFHVPADEEVFALRDEEAARKREERERTKNLHVWEKGVKPGPGGGTPKQHEVVQQSKLNQVAAATRDRRKEKENMADFIAKKREMFLVQMSLDTKREEIRKLEEKAQMKEEALKKSEQMLEEDAIRFDTFLKENDKKAHEAIKKVCSGVSPGGEGAPPRRRVRGAAPASTRAGDITITLTIGGARDEAEDGQGAGDQAPQPADPDGF